MYCLWIISNNTVAILFAVRLVADYEHPMTAMATTGLSYMHLHGISYALSW